MMMMMMLLNPPVSVYKVSSVKRPNKLLELALRLLSCIVELSKSIIFTNVITEENTSIVKTWIHLEK